MSLVSAAGLLLRRIVHVAGIVPGFTPARVVILNVRDEAPRASFGGVDDASVKARRAERYRVLDQRLNAVPGVHAASVSWRLEGDCVSTDLRFRGVDIETAVP